MVILFCHYWWSRESRDLDLPLIHSIQLLLEGKKPL